MEKMSLDHREERERLEGHRLGDVPQCSRFSQQRYADSVGEGGRSNFQPFVAVVFVDRWQIHVDFGWNVKEEEDSSSERDGKEDKLVLDVRGEEEYAIFSEK